jgi:hypothetical protein
MWCGDSLWFGQCDGSNDSIFPSNTFQTLANVPLLTHMIVFLPNQRLTLLRAAATIPRKMSHVTSCSLFSVSDFLEDMGFRNTYADPDFWICPATYSGFDYYEMILVYVDDTLCISKQTASIMKHIASIYHLKDDSIGEPKRYLGANIGTWVLGDGRQVWSMLAASYIQSAVANIESELAHGPHKVLRSKAYQPIKSGYRPEVDVTPLLSE